MEKLVLLGAGGHCKVVLDLIKEQYLITGITDADESKIGKTFYGINIIGNDEFLRYIYKEGTKNALVTLGSVKDNSLRKKLFYFAKDIGFNMINAISEKALLSKTVQMGSGNVIMDGAIIHSDTVIGLNVIVNTGSIIEHDCIIEDHVHISIGARLAGGVRIGEGTFIGMGTNIIQGVTIGKNCVLGAGAVVVKDVPDNSICVGIPAGIIKNV